MVVWGIYMMDRVFVEWLNYYSFDVTVFPACFPCTVVV